MQASVSPGIARYAPTVEHHLLFYKIISDAEGIRLRIWESAAHLDQSPSPYLYILNLRVSSLEEAKRRLKAHLTLNGGMLSSGQALPHKGKVRLMPHATWNSDDGNVY
ncbi:hypothetical protein IQ254_03325 [Nodosilinea sp. LEGE 07088]|uniref:hypothetical protein n=1 Tax=Nodosilinea sp. LEGE 07088 TaxID=2777968 RepID=UPI00187F2A48|nr:hypothetical protein [Nodosilinea sp. LEGE 07088]MBE9136242.1 hypothetical protein [Nodosilinea sp. LEGE 07088]